MDDNGIKFIYPDMEHPRNKPQTMTLADLEKKKADIDANYSKDELVELGKMGGVELDPKMNKGDMITILIDEQVDLDKSLLKNSEDKDKS